MIELLKLDPPSGPAVGRTEVEMSIAERRTQTTWEGALASGKGTFSGGSSGRLDGFEVTWASRTEKPGGKTSPEELLAAAHSSCFSMALVICLSERKLTADRLDVGAVVTLEEVDGVPTITTSALTVRGAVPGADADGFQSAVDQAAGLCPVSRLFASATITVDAQLADA
jgi:osmotically inducible protein OsmC